MKLSGRINEITNLQQFASSFILNPAQPKPGTFKAASGIRIHLSSLLPDLPGGFMPSLSVHVNSASDGRFEFNVPEAQLKQLSLNKMAYLIAYRNVGSVNVAGQTITIFEPVYRGQTFDITTFKGGNHDLFFASQTVTDEEGITQGQVDDQISNAKKKFKELKSLSGTILDGKVHVKGSGHGAEIQFNIELSPSTSPNLDSFIRGKVKAMDIDLPGPDFIVGICVSKDDIEKEVEEKIAGLMKGVNATIKSKLIEELAKQTGQKKSLVEQLFNTKASLTFSKLRFPVVEHKKIKVGPVEIPIDVRAVVPKLSIGFPRAIG